MIGGIPNCHRRLVVVVLAALAMPVGARADDTARPLASISSLVKPSVYVHLRNGGEMAGALLRVTDDEIVMVVNAAETRIPAANVSMVEVPGDSLKNGFFIGAGIGFGLGLLAGAAADDGDDFGAGSIAAVSLVEAGVFGLIGAAIDALIDGRTVVYRASAGQSGARRLSLAPIMTARTKALLLRLHF